TNTPTPATGTIYWQVNKGWPTLLWDLYNYDGDQAGSFFGAKEANDPLHVLYAYDTGAVTVDNLGSAAQSGLSVEAKVHDLSGLRSLAKANVSVTANTTAQPGPNGADTRTTVTITNTSSTPTVGFFLRADVRRGNADGSVQAGDNQVTSALWSDNDTTLWPGESETLVANYASADLHGATPVVSVSGWNVGTVDVAAAQNAAGLDGSAVGVAAHD